jgi:hypothetical protein
MTTEQQPRPSLPSTRFLIELLTDKVFAHALNMMDPALLELADRDDLHACFLAAMVRMSALAHAGTEELLLPRNLVAKLSNAAFGGSLDASFCLHWIALFELQLDGSRTETFGRRLRKAKEWLPPIPDSIYGTYVQEFAQLADALPADLTPEDQLNFGSNVIALLVRFAELLNKAWP